MNLCPKFFMQVKFTFQQQEMVHLLSLHRRNESLWSGLEQNPVTNNTGNFQFHP
ncbi:hypothetical protein HanPSC8_Chr13g0554261 [Helianthus annuus]|nr:hypothetical protein HanPSC8_Chr13g0554261 [Helianthus annuus]